MIPIYPLFILFFLITQQVKSQESNNVLRRISSNNRPSSLQSRYQTNLTPPTNYRYSWGIDGTRLSFGASTGAYLTRFDSLSSTFNQQAIDQCGSKCENTKGCGFFHPIQNSDGSTTCALYTGKVSKSSATFGKVTSSYGFTRNEGPSSGSSSSSSSSTKTTTSSSMTTSKTTSSSTPTSTANFPAGPDRATLIQYQPCPWSPQTLPAFVNKAFASDNKPSDSVHAFIVQHGLARDFQNAYSDVSNLIGESRVLISANFYLTSDSSNVGKNWYQPGKNLAWSQTNDWIGGYNSVEGGCSTYDYYDSLIKLFNNKSLYPNMKKISFIGHSDGGSTISRYAMVSGNSDLPIRYVVANSPTNIYTTSDRPRKSIDPSCSATFNNWIYGPDNRPPYVDSRWSSNTEIFKSYIQKDIVTLVGTQDTYASSTFGDQSCEAIAQGGQNRRDRNYAYWAYKNLLAGSSNDVSQFYGYKTFKANGIKSLNVGPFNHRNCVVGGVGHNAAQMWSSDCGKNALFASYVGSGDPPSRPS